LTPSNGEQLVNFQRRWLTKRSVLRPTSFLLY
jgi:hypothetical protein